MIVPLPFEPRAIFGGPLNGDRALKYIYVDESGKSQHEPVTIVAGVIIDADKQWRNIERQIGELVTEYVPADRRDGFCFHAVDVFHTGRPIDGWPLQQRLALLYAMMSMPRRNELPLAVGVVRRHPRFPVASKLTHYEVDHLFAFQNMIAVADRYMRRETDKDEVLTVVYEDLDRCKKELRGMLELLRNHPFKLGSEHLNFTSSLKPKEIVDACGEMAVTRVIDTIFYAEKRSAPLLQLADACAFGLRRYFSNKERGDEMLKVIIGGDLKDPDVWSGKVHGNLWQWKPFNLTSSSEAINFRRLG